MRTRLIVAALAFAAGAGFPGMAHAQICAGTAPHLTGEWVTLPYQMPINPITATLLRSGQVLIVAGSENDARNNSEGSESYRAALWDPAGIDQSSITVENSTTTCSAAARPTLPDGRALVVGGTSRLLFHRREPRLILRSADGAVRPVAEHGGWPLVRHCHDARRWAGHGVLRARPDRRHQQHRRDLRPEQRRRRVDSARSLPRSLRRSIRT